MTSQPLFQRLHHHTPLRTLSLAISTALLTLSLTACGGGNDSGSHHHNQQGNSNNGHSQGHNHGGSDQTNNDQNLFTETATWKVDTNKEELMTCYDFDSKKEIECTGNKWDLKLEKKARSTKLWTNSGISGDGKGAAFYLMPLKSDKGYSLSSIKDATTVPPAGYRIDSGEGVFVKHPWAEYNLRQQHKMAPNNRVYLITTDYTDAHTNSTANRPIYAIQVIGYYNQEGKSGYPEIRWIDTALPTQVHQQNIDASSYTDWTYFNLTTGKTTTKDGDWHIGLKRNNIILNSGASGNGKVGGYLAKTPSGYYDKDGNAIKSKFAPDQAENNLKQSLEDLTQVNEYDINKEGVPWVTDTKGSQLNPKPTGHYPVIDFGWYNYRGDKGHILEAKSEDEAIGTILRSGEGDSYAKMRLESIENGVWTFKFEIQPKTKS